MAKIITTNLLNRFWKNGIKPIKDEVTQLNSNLTLKSVGNAVAATGWTIYASNVVINGIGLLYGTIIHEVDDTPNWGDLIATFPNFSSQYNVPTLLYCTDGNIYTTATIVPDGTLRLYSPDFAKLSAKGKVYNFNAVYYANM